MAINFSNIINDINNSKVISFDVFDTLITRNLIEPKDIFFYVGLKASKDLKLRLHPEKFVALRLQAEKDARNLSSRADITINEIYKNLSEKLIIDYETSLKIKQIELDAELKFITNRPEIKELYEYARSKNKQIFLVSDMYLSRNFILKLLRKAGYSEIKLDQILVSSEFGKLKFDGKLFEELINIAGTKDILHIGDTFKVDTKGARSVGLKGYYCENAHSEFIKIPEISKLFGRYLRAPEKKMGLSLSLGIFANSLLRNIHPSKIYNRESLFDGKAYNIGFMGLGIFLVSFCLWLKEYSERNNIRNLYFLARDGYILKRVFDSLFDPKDVSISSRYLISSRRMYSIPSIFNKKDLNVIFNNSYTGKIDKFICNRLGLASNLEKCLIKLQDLKLIDSSDDVVTTNGDGLIKLRMIVGALEDEILKEASTEREALCKYFNATIDKEHKGALVDLGYNGSIAAYFNKITGCNFESINVLADSSSLERTGIPADLMITGWANDQIPFVDYNFNLRNIIPLFESLFSCKQNQAEKAIINSKNQYEIVYINDLESQSEKRLQFIEEVERGCLDFSEQFANFIPGEEIFFNLDCITSSKILARHFAQPLLFDLSIWDGIYFENNFAGWENKTIFSSADSTSTLWNVAQDVINGENKSPRLPLVHSESIPEPETIIERYVFVVSGKKKFMKFKRSPKKFFMDSKNPVCKFIAICLKK